MSFKQNLQKKIELDQAARKVLATIRPAGTPHHIDKDAMRYLLDAAGYTHERRRDVDLYYQADKGDPPESILVLDNDLSVYASTIQDVVMRKSPYVKEMISLRNIKKILSDAGVIQTKKADTVRRVHGECIEGLDLSFTQADLDALKMDALAALDSGDADDLLLTMQYFAEILDYDPPPPFLAVAGYFILSGRMAGAEGVDIFGPHIIYDKRRNQLLLITAPIKQTEKAKIDHYLKSVQGSAEADRRNADVIAFLREAADGIGEIRQDHTIYG